MTCLWVRETERVMERACGVEKMCWRGDFVVVVSGIATEIGLLVPGSPRRREEEEKGGRRLMEVAKILGTFW